MHCVSPLAHLHVVGMLRFMSGVNQPSLPTSFYSVLVSVSVFMALSTVFHGISSPDNSPLCHSVRISALLALSTIYLFKKFSLSPDVILCGWLGLKHQLTNFACMHRIVITFSFIKLFKELDTFCSSVQKLLKELVQGEFLNNVGSGLHLDSQVAGVFANRARPIFEQGT